MKEIVRPRFDGSPYSLHDSHICAMELQNDELLLVFNCGYLDTTPPFGQVQGRIRISGLDLDFCSVYLMEYIDVPCGNCGRFHGRKLPLDDFIHRFEGLDVIDETYGYDQLRLAGFSPCGEGLQECVIEIFYQGDMSYLVEDCR